MQSTNLLHDFEAAKLLKMRTNKLVRLAKQGKISCVLLPDGVVRFVEADVLAWIEDYKVVASCQPNKKEGNND